MAINLPTTVVEAAVNPASPGLGRTAKAASADRGEDADLLVRVRADGFDTPTYEGLRDRLWSYTFPVLKDALRLGKIERICRKRGVLVRVASADAEALHTSIEERDALTVDTLVLAEQYFRKTAILRHRWTPSGGASLETYFTGAAWLKFPDAYAAWSRERSDRLIAASYGLTPTTVGERLAPSAGPEDSAAVRDLVARVFALGTPTARAVMALMLEDLTQAEIGARLGISERAVEGQVYRVRRAIGRQKNSGNLPRLVKS